MNEEQDLLPVEQQTLTFYGKPIVVVRLPGGRPGVVLRFLCENLQIDTAALPGANITGRWCSGLTGNKISKPGVEASSPGWYAWKKPPT